MKWQEWNRTTDQRTRPYLTDDEEGSIWYFMGYDPDASFSSTAKSRVKNFKKSGLIKTAKPTEWYWRCKAVNEFADDLLLLIPPHSNVTYIPSTMLKDNPNYNNRYEDLFERMARLSLTLNLLHLFSCRAEITPAHEQGSRNPGVIEKNLQIEESLLDGLDHLYVIDDVITTGGHFKACKNKIARTHPDIGITGAFWGLTTNPEVE